MTRGEIALYASRDAESTIREREGLPSDSIILIPVYDRPPMRHPDAVWAMRVNVVGVEDEYEGGHHRCEVDLLAATWIRHTPACGQHDGDLVIRLMSPADSGAVHGMVDVEMLLAHNQKWQCVGLWLGVDERWPQVVAPTAKAVMDLHTELVEAGVRCDGETKPTMTSPSIMGNTYGDGLGLLIEEGVIRSGDEFVWDRRRLGVRHTLRVRADGALELGDGRICASPTAAATALGGLNQSGWSVFVRTSDGQPLADLRARARERAASAGARPSE